jgi:F420-0:gamma-glutamyl ligase
MMVKPIKTRIFKENEPLVKFIQEYIKKIPERSIIVVTSKIVALSEGRTAEDTGPKAKEILIKAESEAMIRTKYIHLTIKDGMLMAAAGIDASNGAGRFIMLPKDSFKAARILRSQLKKIYNVKDLGVLITDSRTFPLRAGVIGLTTGFAGFLGIRDYRGVKDIFGRKLAFSRTNVADCLSSAAVVEMGEAAERHPLAVIREATVEFTNKTVWRSSVSIPIEDDLYKSVLTPLLKKRNKK